MTKTILVAEDDPDVRTMLFSILKSANYNVVTAKDGRDALRIIMEKGMPDVMVVDHNMPGLTGLDLIAEVRRREEKRQVVAILITATHMRTSDDVKAALVHADLMLGKPFDYQQLLKLIQRLTTKPD